MMSEKRNDNMALQAGRGARKFLDDFKSFAMKGNVIDLAVGMMIGTAFGKIVSSLVADIFMPLIGLLTGGFNLSGLFFALDGNTYASVQAATDAGVGVFSYGAFLTSVIDFILIALCVFLFVKIMGKMMPKKAEAPVTRVCPFCHSDVSIEATRCPFCTSELVPVEQSKAAD